jgi:hypothetical protein
MPVLPDIKPMCYRVSQLPNLEAVTLPSTSFSQQQHGKLSSAGVDYSVFCIRKDVQETRMRPFAKRRWRAKHQRSGLKARQTVASSVVPATVLLEDNESAGSVQIQ